VTYDFVLADVFTDRAFGGNQLAVFPDARGISTARMQALAREFNFSETTFVLPPDNPEHTAKVRIFTPSTELNFAGHPTIGTTAVLAAQGAVPGGTAVLELGVGPVPVRVDGSYGELTLTREPEIPGVQPDPCALAETLGLSTPDVVGGWFATVGLPFCFAQLTDPSTVDRAALDPTAWREHFSDAWSSDIYLFAGDTEPGSTLYARMFAPGYGVAEDPATASACAALVGTLAGRWPAPDGTYRLTVRQGVRMGRASTIDATATKKSGRIASVSVGGSTVLVGSGRIMLP
jgi:trans-2,3-dihydro-3-hydroxyanthranilate isomerase